MNFEPSQKSQDYLNRVKAFMQDHVLPVEQTVVAHNHAKNSTNDWTSWQLAPQIDLLKARAKQAGLWNLFLPDSTLAQGLSCLEYAPIAEQMGHCLFASDVFNCNAPDTGNMEVLYHFANDEQKHQWLTPLLNGEIRSVFAMTEPDIASSDATNMQATIDVDGDDLILNGKKWWTTGLGHPNAQVAIFMGLSNPENDKHSQHSMVLVPLNTSGVNIKRMLSACGDFDPPYGHGEMEFNNVRVPKKILF